MTVFLSGGCISLLLCVLKYSLAAAAIPPPAISLSGSSLAAALLLPDNSTLTSNLNVTQQQQELLQLSNSNQTSARFVEIPKASPRLSILSDHGIAAVSQPLSSNTLSPAPPTI